MLRGGKATTRVSSFGRIIYLQQRKHREALEIILFYCGNLIACQSPKKYSFDLNCLSHFSSV